MVLMTFYYDMTANVWIIVGSVKLLMVNFLTQRKLVKVQVWDILVIEFLYDAMHLQNSFNLRCLLDSVGFVDVIIQR